MTYTLKLMGTRRCGACCKEIKKGDRVYQLESDDESFFYLHKDCLEKKKAIIIDC